MPFRHLPFRLTLIGAALLALAPAHAQESTPASKAEPLKPAVPAEVQKIEVRGSYDARRDDTAGKIVINHDEITKYGDVNVLDVLKRLPGVTVVGGGVRMRGLGSGYTQVLLNGERMPAGFSLDSLAPNTIEKIEVVRSATAEVSTQAIAGTINIVLKKAISVAQREAKLGVRASRGFATPNANVQLSDRDGAFSYSLTVNASHQIIDVTSHAFEETRHSDGELIAQDRIARRSDGRYSIANVAPRLNWALDGGDTLTWQSYAGLGHYRGSEFAQAPLAGTEDRTVKPSRVLRSDVTLVHKLAKESKLELKLGANWHRNHNQNRQLAHDGDAQLVVDRDIGTGADGSGVTFTGKYSTPIAPGHALDAGWDGGALEYAEQRVQRGRIPDDGQFDADAQYASRIGRLAVYLQDEWTVTPQWSVYLGARWEGSRTRNSGSDFDPVSSRSSVLSPIFQTLYKLPKSSGDQLRFALARTYKGPGTFALMPRRFYAAVNAQGTPDQIGNPALEPEIALGFDASYEHRWGSGALFSISASSREIDNVIRWRLDQDADGQWVTAPANDGKARTHGLELEAKFALKELIDNAPAIDLRASFSRNWSKVDGVPGPDNRLDRQTPVSATLGVDYQGGALSGGGCFSFRNGGPVRISALQSAYTRPERYLDLYALWKINPKNQLRLTFGTPFGADAETRNTYTDDGISRSYSIVNPNFVMAGASLEMKF